jgi:hypothetical protein
MPERRKAVALSAGIFGQCLRHDKCFTDESMAIGLAWGQTTFRMLGAMSTRKRDWVWKFLARGRERVTLGSAPSRRRVAFDDGILVVCVLAFAALLLLGSVVMLLSLTTASLPTSTFNSHPEFDVYATPADDGNESLSMDEPLRSGQPSMTP